MNAAEFDVLVRDQFEACENVLITKGADYTDGEDRLSNFKDVAKRTGITPLQCWNVYFQKHLCAIDKYVRDEKVESEPIGGRVTDAINYLMLGLALIKESQKNGK